MGNFNRDKKSGSRGGFNRRDSGKRGFGGRGGKREMYKTVCGKCGKNCEVPFVPTDGRPVYCSECFEKKDGGSPSPRNFQDRGPRRPNFERRNDLRSQNNEQLETINRKLDNILEALTALSLKEKKEVVTKPIEVVIIDQKKTKASKKRRTVKRK